MTEKPGMSMSAAYEQLTGFARDNARIAAAYFKSLRAEDVPRLAAVALTCSYVQGHMTNWGRDTPPIE
jgi:hypothetical protein